MQSSSTRSEPRRLLVMGASAGIGLEVVRQGLAAGYKVRAFARGAHRMVLQHERLELVSGDARSPTDVRAALRDTEAVIQTLGVPFNLRLFTGPINLFSEATEVVLDVMPSTECTRLLSVTGFGAGDSQGSIHPLQRLGFNLVFGRAYADKSKQEQMIKNSNLNWTIVRPGVLTNQANPRKYRALLEPTDWRNGIVSRAAVANFLISAIPDQNTFGKSPVVIRAGMSD